MLAKIVRHFLPAELDNSLFFSMKTHTEVTDYRTTKCPASIKRFGSSYYLYFFFTRLYSFKVYMFRDLSKTKTGPQGVLEFLFSVRLQLLFKSKIVCFCLLHCLED